MERAPSSDLRCVWMTAGLVRYRLCDREYDCDRCPLDAALRGVEPRTGEAGDATLRPAVTFPADRRYARGHTWAEPRCGTVRVGLDGLAAVLCGRPQGVRYGAFRRRYDRGATLGEIDLGTGGLPLGAPVSGRLVGVNRALADAEPRALVGDPYGAGWLFELAPDADGVATLADAARARRRAVHDLRRFRRQVALSMLAAEERLGVTLPDGGEAVTDLCSLLGAPRYLALLRELIH